MKTYEATFVQSVAAPTSVIDKARERFEGSIVTVDSFDDVGSINIRTDGPNLVIVDLPHTTGGKKLEKLLQIGAV